MEANIGERLLLADIAQAAHLSRSHFARSFRITTGLSVMVYLRRLRIEKAKLLLIERDVGIAELSAQLGFTHHSHFTRLFRRHVGMAPRTYAHLFGAPEALGDEPSLEALNDQNAKNSTICQIKARSCKT